MSDALCTKYGCDYQLDLDGQITCANCGAMDDDMLPRRTYNEPELNESGYGYDELKDFDEYKDNNKSKITPFLGPNR
jgi:hypothetical protein